MKGQAFGDRARLLAEWFQDWNSCEQTIALYSLLSKVSATQARFLSLVLEHSLQNGCDSQELTKLEKEANNAAFLSSLHSQSEAAALAQLLVHIPLLNPGNVEARREYMKLLPKVLLGSSEELDYLDQCRQLLSLALVHPAFPHEDREALTYWLARLDEKQRNIMERNPAAASQRPPPIPPRKIYQTKSEDSGGLRSNGSRIYLNGYLNQLMPAHSEGSLDRLETGSLESFNPDEEELQRCNSLQPGHSLYGSAEHPLPPPNGYDDYFTRGALKTGSLPVPRTASVCSLPGIHSIMGAVDEMGAGPMFSIDWKPGMKDVPMWLKSLRLHKYQHLFAELGYEEMLQISEDYLEEKNVTKGARNKIILSITKLVRRPETLVEIEQDMEKHGRLLPCINEVHQMLRTPLKPYSPSEEGGQGQHKHKSRRKAKASSHRPEAEGGATSDEEGDSSSGSSSDSPTESPRPQRSSSDGGSDLEELLTKDFPHEDLPSLLTRAMGKAYSQLMLHTDTNEENLGAFIKLLDTAMPHEAFKVDHRKLFFEWKQQCQQTLRVISPKKSPRGRGWGPGFSFTFAGMPSQASSRGGKSRTLRSMRNGGPGKGLISSASRASSTLPRMSARQLQQPLPPHTSSFSRPKSSVLTFSPSQMSVQAKPFIPTPHSSGSAFAPPPPLPPRTCEPPLSPRTCELNEADMDDLSKRVTDHVLDDMSDS